MSREDNATHLRGGQVEAAVARGGQQRDVVAPGHGQRAGDLAHEVVEGVDVAAQVPEREERELVRFLIDSIEIATLVYPMLIDL